MEIHEKIKAIMDEKNMTVYKLSKASGLSQTGITYLINGERSPTYDTLKKICAAMDIPVSSLFDDDIANDRRDRSGEIAAAHIDGDKSYEDLSPEALQQLEEYKQFLIQKYGKKK